MTHHATTAERRAAVRQALHLMSRAQEAVRSGHLHAAIAALQHATKLLQQHQQQYQVASIPQKEKTL